MAAAGLATVMLVRSVVDGHLVTPLQIAASERNIHNLSEIYIFSRSAVTDWMVWITFLWLLPFAIRGRDRLPAQAGVATFTSVAGTLALSVWTSTAASHAIRPVFDVAAPWLCLAFAIGATRMSFHTSHENMTN
jgi:hypothetical protein